MTLHFPCDATEIQMEFRNDFLQQTQPNKPTTLTFSVAGGCSNQSNRETAKCFFGGDVFCLMFFLLLFDRVPKIVVHRGEKYKKSSICGLEGPSRMMALFVCKISLTLKLVCSFSLGEFVPFFANLYLSRKAPFKTSLACVSWPKLELISHNQVITESRQTSSVNQTAY